VSLAAGSRQQQQPGRRRNRLHTQHISAGLSQAGKMVAFCVLPETGRQ